MIIEEVDEGLFISRFKDYNRVATAENPNGNFTYKGLRALFQYLEESFEESNPLKLDVIGLCCDYSEYENIDEYDKAYNLSAKREELGEDYNEAVETEINNATTLIKFEDDLDEGFIIQNY